MSSQDLYLQLVLQQAVIFHFHQYADILLIYQLIG